MTREEIIEAISEDKMMPFIQPEQLAEIVDFVIKSYQPSLPSNLDEAAEMNFETMEVLEHENIFEETHRKIFKAGAEWMAGQGETLEVEVKEDAGGYPYIQSIELYDYDKDEPLSKQGDNVVVQIRKK